MRSEVNFTSIVNDRESWVDNVAEKVIEILLRLSTTYCVPEPGSPDSRLIQTKYRNIHNILTK